VAESGAAAASPAQKQAHAGRPRGRLRRPSSPGAPGRPFWHAWAHGRGRGRAHRRKASASRAASASASALPSALALSADVSSFFTAAPNAVPSSCGRGHRVGVGYSMARVGSGLTPSAPQRSVARLPYGPCDELPTQRPAAGTAAEAPRCPAVCRPPLPCALAARPEPASAAPESGKAAQQRGFRNMRVRAAPTTRVGTAARVRRPRPAPALSCGAGAARQVKHAGGDEQGDDVGRLPGGHGRAVHLKRAALAQRVDQHRQQRRVQHLGRRAGRRVRVRVRVCSGARADVLSPAACSPAPCAHGASPRSRPSGRVCRRAARPCNGALGGASVGS